MSELKNVLPIDREISGKSHILYQEIVDVIWSGKYDDMTLSEIVGTLFLAMQDISRGGT
jgi:hypothetical protein